ncbi:YheV family putative zinc ribbon protein [Thorsellia anophelis]|uniref:Metal-binding protein n=1 Tax=Thorsellia anophelis DSM 18579 TaxID=1123402 RepID=A0A1H9Y7M3_9GAMM|nr:YheV family putative zinc ribbon protein [Thorsellia anophelis]SES64785.1 hypothetical protein SAMN02583745_00101 [Thorsellia anophelis DSM 18579]
MNIIESKKRFIAGAACPNCKALDTLRLWQHQEFDINHRLIYETEIVECVECLHTQTQVIKDTPESVSPNQLIGQFKLD